MSQILRLTRNFQLKTLSHSQTLVCGETVFICKGCQRLRNEFSTNPSLKPQHVLYKKKKWKKRETLYKKLSRSLDARLVQLSASPGNQQFSQRGDQSLYLLGNKTSKDGRVEQNVFYVGNAFSAEHIAKLEKEIDLLRGQKVTQIPASNKSMPKRTDLISETSSKPKAKLKDIAQKSLTSTVIEKSDRDLKAMPVISDNLKGDIHDLSAKLCSLSSSVSDRLTGGSDTYFTEEVPKDAVLNALSHGKTNEMSSVFQLKDYDHGIKEMWTDEVAKEKIDGDSFVSIKDKPIEHITSKTKKKKRKRKSKISEIKFVSKPAHVKTVDIARTPLVQEVVDNAVVASDQGNKAVGAPETSGSNMEEPVKIDNVHVHVESAKYKSSQKAKRKKNLTKASRSTVATEIKLRNQGVATTESDVAISTDLADPGSDIATNTQKKKAAKSAKSEKLSLESAILIFNQDLRSFVDACCYVGLYENALETVNHYRNLQNSGHKKFSISDVEIYNSIILCLADKGDLKGIQEVLAMMNEDCVKPDLRTHAMSLYCLGRNEHLDPKVAQYIVSDMEREGLDVNDIFTKVEFIGREKDVILKVLQKVTPGFELSDLEDGLTYTGPLVEELNTPLPKSQVVEPNPYLGVLTSDEIVKKADTQFRRELDSYVHVESIMKKPADTTHNKHKKRKKQSKESLEKARTLWRLELTKEYRSKLQRLEKKFHASSSMSLYPFFKLLPEEVYIDMLMKEIEFLGSFGEHYSPSVTSLYKDLAQKVSDRSHVQYMADNKIIPKMRKIFKNYTEKIMDTDIDNINHRTCWLEVQKEVTGGQSLEVEERLWSPFLKKALGKELYDIIFKKVKVAAHQRGAGGQKKMVPAFVTVIRPKELYLEEEIKPHPEFLKLMGTRDDLMFQTAELPMLIPPLPWVSPTQGCNFFNTKKTIRWHIGQQMKMFKATIDTGPVLDSLNILGACPWKVNKPVLDIIIKVFSSGGDDFLDIPILPSSIEQPQKPKGKLSKEGKAKAYKERLSYKKQVNEATSLWYSSLYKFSIANHFRDEIFWFPHNMDFRGRTYALPPHFNQLGGDTARAIIKFAKGKPLGPNGLDWLKIHLVNLTGLKKRSSLAERLTFANDMMEDILDSADNPLEGKRWWSNSEEPWQTLACCLEIAEASRSEDPTKFVSSYPVHQDGSCNGLQHYAAMGRDTAGAKSVNLFPFDTPSDVYQEVVELVEQKRQRDLIEGDEKLKEAAKICEGHVERKVIKQTIMTTVYGVTKYGARLQIAKQLKERDMPKDKIILARTYLADSTFLCLQQMFSSAKQIQDWFNACAVNICGIGQKPVEWLTPLNFPVIQPYFRQLRASSFGVSVTSSSLENQHPSVVKQKNAFAPNYVHSLDSTHMMLTSLFCLRAGITFVSVHDCFWTHPCDVEVMNKITREQFISLHKQPILENLSKYFVKTYCERHVQNTSQDSSVIETGDQLSFDSQSGSSSPLTDQLNSSSQVLDTRQLDIAAELNNSDTCTPSEFMAYSNVALIKANVNQSSISADLDVNQSELVNDLDVSNYVGISQSEDATELELGQSDKTSDKDGSQVTRDNYPRNRLSDHEKMAHLNRVLTSVPERGDFDLEKVLESTYFFS